MIKSISVLIGKTILNLGQLGKPVVGSSATVRAAQAEP